MRSKMASCNSSMVISSQDFGVEEVFAGSVFFSVALADPEQRIYDFRGADPKRITQFIESFKPKIFDFGQQNNRSNGKDIAEFGNDLLQGKNTGKQYKDVSV